MTHLELISLIQAVSATAAWGVGMFFWRFWRDTRDRLFLLFAGAFALISASFAGLALFDPQDEIQPSIYGLRLVAFGLIIAAILDKNRKAAP
jgi:hypothetical protein